LIPPGERRAIAVGGSMSGLFAARHRTSEAVMTEIAVPDFPGV
jgi:hypothetical protein